MRVLTKLEKKEFEKTFNFINLWVGTAHWLEAKNVHNLRFVYYVKTTEILKFIGKEDYDGKQ